MKTDIETLRDSFKISYEALEDSRKEAMMVMDLYHNRQYTDAQLSILETRGQPKETFNIVKMFGRMLLGYYSTIVNEVIITPKKEDQIINASILNDLVSYTLATDLQTVSGLTFSGSTGTNAAFYPIAQNKYVASLIDTPTINIQNGVAVSKPQVIGKVQGLEPETRQMFAELMQATVIVVVKTVDARYYIVGIDNGLDLVTGSLGTEAAADGFKGFSFTLEGLESKPFIELESWLNFESTYVVTP